MKYAHRVAVALSAALLTVVSTPATADELMSPTQTEVRSAAGPLTETARRVRRREPQSHQLGPFAKLRRARYTLSRIKELKSIRQAKAR